MSTGPQAVLLADGRRLHLHHGPIDMIVEAFGPPAEVAQAQSQAIAAFAPVLHTLVAELPLLRRPVSAETRALVSGSVARRMVEAVWPHRELVVTPMAAVAGAVAEHVLAAAVKGRGLARAYANNGGDIALYLTPGESLSAAIFALPQTDGQAGRLLVPAESRVRGIATSGWRGRSQSLGIADAVTVLADTAARADAAATMIANAVDLPGHPAILRRPAQDLVADSDLGRRPVTTAVGPLDDAEIADALNRGMGTALELRARGLIVEAALFLAGRSRLSGPMSLSPLPGAAHA